MRLSFQNELDQLVSTHQQIRTLNPALEKCYPVVIVMQDKFCIFDLDSTGRQYHWIKNVPRPMPVPAGVRAAFQIQDYDGRIACVVTPEVFDTPEGYVTILHEFVHCYQYETSEQALKAGLDVARKAQEVGDVMWEINHPFPYTAADFITPYCGFLRALNEQDHQGIITARRMLKAYLGVHDYEYMVWQEWKEGFARWAENLIRRHLGLPENLGGLTQPYSRVVFYAGGNAYIDYLAEVFPPVVTDLTALFVRMLAI